MNTKAKHSHSFWQNLFTKSKKEPSVQGVIFDLDGTIFDTQTPVHATIDSQLIESFTGAKVTPQEITARFAGRHIDQIIEYYSPVKPTRKQVESLVAQKHQRLLNFIKTHPIEVFQEVAHFILLLHQEGIPMAIASSSPKDYLEHMTNDKNVFAGKPLTAYIPNEHILSGTSFAYPKPSPDIFVVAARRLGVDPAGCVVVGDSDVDIIGGLSAGMFVVYVGAETQENIFLRYGSLVSSRVCVVSHAKELSSSWDRNKLNICRYMRHMQMIM